MPDANFKLCNKWLLLFENNSRTGPATSGEVGRGGYFPPPLSPPLPPHTHTHTYTHFFGSKKKREANEQTKKRKSFKAETTKRLSPRSKCYSFSHSKASRIQFYSGHPTMVADNTRQCSMAFSILKLISPALQKLNIGGKTLLQLLL